MGQAISVVTPAKGVQIAHWFEQALEALERASSVDEAKAIRDQAEALRVYARQARLALPMQQHITEIKLRAERRTGELLATMEKQHGGVRDAMGLQHATPLPDTLSDLGIEKTQSSRFQKLASIPEPTFNRIVQRAKDNEEELTTALVMRAALRTDFQSESDDWNTPAPIIERVVSALGAIDLDPCAGNGTVPARHRFTVEDNGLAQPWFGRVYLNPPYGRTIGDWTGKLAVEFAAGHTTAAVALLPARTDAQWFHALEPEHVCFIEGRIHFNDHENPAPFPSIVVYLGNEPVRFYAAFAESGDCYTRVGIEAA